MKLLSLALLRWHHDSSVGPEPVILDAAYNLSDFGFFQRGGMKEMLTFVSRTVIKRTRLGGRQVVKHEGYLCYGHLRADGLGVLIVADGEYPARVAFGNAQVLMDRCDAEHGDRWRTVTSNFGLPLSGLSDELNRMQDPAQCDKITKINATLDETKEEVKTIDSILERGANLDRLVEQSEDLSSRSKMFYKEAKRTNSSCCVIV